MKHLEEAKRFARSADGVDITWDWAQVNAQLATAHATIALVELLAERLPLPTETASECQARLKEEHDEGV